MEISMQHNDDDLCDSFTISQIENEINKLYPQIQNLKEPKSKSELHSTEWNRLFAQLGFWVILFSEKHDSSKDISRYEDEITECTRRCIDSFNPARGKPFINYLTKALNKTLNKAIKTEIDLEKKITATQPPSR